MDGTEWFADAIMYHILIDRFAGFPSKKGWDTPKFLGGTINGILEKLPYLQDLGINTIWISPFYKTSAYHGYHITDFMSVDPHFGTLQDIKQLITTVHHHDMRIIADFVPNHCSTEHPFFKEAQADPQSPYKDWFYFTQWPNEYRCFLSIKEIPKLNLDNPEVQQHIINAAFYWLSLGFDGYRLDHVIGPSHDFWRKFRIHLKQSYPHVVLIGEAWMMGIRRKELRTIHIRHKLLKWLFGGSSSENLFREYIDELDGVLDFKVQEYLRKAVTNPQYSKQALKRELKRHYAHFPESFFLPTFLDNHDMDRFLFYCGQDKEKLKQAAQLQFSLPQPPIIYYGTEKGMTQHTSLWKIKSHGDLQARQPMKWEYNDTELLNFYKTLIQKRKNQSSHPRGI